MSRACRWKPISGLVPDDLAGASTGLQRLVSLQYPALAFEIIRGPKQRFKYTSSVFVFRSGGAKQND